MNREHDPHALDTERATSPQLGGDLLPGRQTLTASLRAPETEPTRRPPEIATAAARRGDVDGLRAWLDDGGEINAHDNEGWTPLLAAAVRGRAEAVELLLARGADPAVQHRASGALPIHFAGHAASVPVAELLLARRPDHLDAVWDLNGHTLLLQAAFYATPAHEDVARFALERGASVTVTTVRGVAPLEMALQFNNQRMAEIIRAYDRTEQAGPEGEQLRAAKAAYTRELLQRLAPAPVPERERPIQALTDRAIATIEGGLREAARDPESVPATIRTLAEIVATPGFEPNRLGGALQQPPMVVAVTGGNAGNEAIAQLRQQIVELLVAAGADPMTQEVHPMAVDAFIRAMVFNHIDALRAMAASPTMTPERLAEALNRAPVANGLTGFHDTILRAGRAPDAQVPQFLEQIRWCIANGARTDIEDFSGRTQADLARAIPDPARRAMVLDAMGLSG